MRVLLINRPDALTSPGGDTVQVLQTQAALQRLGVEADVRFELNPQAGSYDLAHVFNVQRPAETLAQMHACRHAGVPIAHSPVIWDFWRVSFEVSARWRSLRRFVPSALLAPFCWARENELVRFGRTWRMEREALALADVVLPNSRGEADFLQRRFGLGLESRTRIVPNAVDVGRFNPAGAAARRAQLQLPPEGCVLQVGRIEPTKNQLATIRALLDVPVPLAFVGYEPHWAGDYLERCRELARQRGNVYFLGAIPEEDLAPTYARAKVHVLPSFRENTGLVTLEAALMGCNVVTTDMGPTYEYFGEWAWYCSPSSTRSIRRAILGALDAPARPQLAERIRRHFTWDEAARRTLAAYEWVLAGRKPGDQRPGPLATTCGK